MKNLGVAILGIMLLASAAARAEDSSFVSFDPPGATQTRALGMNERGDIVGFYRSGGVMRGFLRDNYGDFSTLMPSGASFAVVHGINNQGVMVGRFGEASTGDIRGFVAIDGVLTPFDYPGSTHVEPEDINEKGEISGKYIDPSGAQHGFELVDGVFTTVDVAGAATTDLQSVCNSGVGVGDIGVGPLVESFISNRGSFEIFDFPGASVTGARFRSESDEIVGVVVNGTGEHGFRRERDGSYTQIDYPGAAVTRIFAGNDQGDSAGSYILGGVEHGLILQRH